MRSLLIAAVAVLGAGRFVAFADDPKPGEIKISLADFKFKNEGGGEGGEGMGYNDGDSKIFFYAAGTATQEIKVPADGDYTLTVEASCDEAQNEKAKMSVKVGDKVVEKEFLLKETTPKEYTFKVTLKKGSPKLELGFTNDAFKEGEYDRNLYIHAVKLEPAKKK